MYILLLVSSPQKLKILLPITIPTVAHTQHLNAVVKGILQMLRYIISILRKLMKYWKQLQTCY